jgi:hypothetical protein
VLNGLYTWPDVADLLPRLAVTESSFAQFSNQVLSTPPVPTGVHERRDKCSNRAGAVSSYQGLWPDEATGGVAIGMMQVYLTNEKSSSQKEKVAWNWIENACAGAKVFDRALGTAGRHSKKMVKRDPGLQALSRTNLEGEALGLHKGFGSKDNEPTVWYLVPQCCSDTSLTKGTCPSGVTWQWIQNPNPCADGGSNCPNNQKVTYLVGLVLSAPATDPCSQTNEAVTQSCGP